MFPKKGSHVIRIGQQQTYIVPFYPCSHITKVCWLTVNKGYNGWPVDNFSDNCDDPNKIQYTCSSGEYRTLVLYFCFRFYSLKWLVSHASYRPELKGTILTKIWPVDNFSYSTTVYIFPPNVIKHPSNYS